MDSEFNGHGGELISLALVRESQDLKSLYMIMPPSSASPEWLPWVKVNVIRHLDAVPMGIVTSLPNSIPQAQAMLERYFQGDTDPVVITDWPEDIIYFCNLLLTKPGEMISLPSLKFEMRRVNAYPTRVVGAVQHNAWWDAVALRQKLMETDTTK